MRWCILFLLTPFLSNSQVNWKNVDTAFAPLPNGLHVFYSNDSIEGKPSIAYYLSAELKEKHFDFTTQVGNGKRYTPAQYFATEANPVVVVNAGFFEYAHNSNLNVVMKDGKMLAYNSHDIPGRGKDTFTYVHAFYSALGISRKRQADVAWVFTDSSQPYPLAMEEPLRSFRDSIQGLSSEHFREYAAASGIRDISEWKMETAVGGGPSLLKDGEINITNEEEKKFNGKAINDRHPRTCMGYTRDGKLIILVIEGRHPGRAEGATLGQEARILKDIGCREALNLDGGGSSCLLVNGKETITPSEKGEERPVPSVFMIKRQ